MRRTSLIAVSLAAMPLLLCPLPGPAAAQAQDRTRCTVVDVEGPSARIWADGLWSPRGTGAAVPRDAKIVTDAQTRARIRCDDGLAVTVGTSTEVNLESLAEIGPGRVMQIIQGVLGIFGGDGAAAGMKVRTPLLIASVRSTRWTAEHAPAEGSAVFVRSGRVHVVGRDRAAVDLTDGQGVSVSAGGETGALKTWGAPRIRKTMDALGFGWN